MDFNFNNEILREALERLREDNRDENLIKVASLLVDTKIMIPAKWDKEPEVDEKGQLHFEPDTKVMPMVVTNENGLKLLIASSKPEKFVKNILSQHDLLKYFAFAGGSLLDGSRINKDDVLAYVLEQMQITDLNDCIMVGDRKYDVIGAKKFNLKCVGVTYGYGSLEELKNINADFIIDKPLELLSIIK